MHAATTANPHLHSEPHILACPCKNRLSTLKKALWMLGFITHILLAFSIPVVGSLMGYYGDVFDLGKHCRLYTEGFAKDSCENSASVVTLFFGILVILILLLSSVGISILLRAKFYTVWGHCGWMGNKIGRSCRWFWGFGREEILGVGGQRRGLGIMATQAHFPDGQVWLCERCSRDTTTV